ncbi:MAG: gliding motility-associated C-terminal domain-containing protein [Chitinophagaceae bacterium]
MHKYLFIIALLLASIARADTFVVTDPRDLTSAGTLRWALQSAKDNGNQPTWDTIRFSIPSGAAAARAIQILSQLPLVSSYLVIDGTTQFPGAAFGTSDAKIAITPKVFDNAPRGLVLRNVDHVEIYGILFAGFINSPPQNSVTWRDGIFMWNVHDIVIGAEGKGNAFFGCYNSIRHEAIPEDSRDPPPTGIGYNIRIQNNEIGKNNTGRPATREGVVNAIGLFDVFNIAIGGYANREQNRFMVFLNGIQIRLKPTSTGANGYVNIVNNDFIVGTSTPALPIALPISAIQVTDNAANQGNHYVNVSGNQILAYTAGISLSGLKHPFSIVRNTIDCDRANNSFGASTAMAIAGSDSGMIGGRDSVNILHDTKNFGIALAGTKFIKMSRNSIFCTPKGINIIAPATTLPRITDLYIDAGGAAHGNTCAGCEVEVFDTRDCMNEYYNGETYLASVTADASGVFTYSGTSISCYNTSFTTTNASPTTSAFYIPYNFIFDTTTVLIQHASCGLNNGSIKNIKIFSGVDFHWEDNNGNIVGIDTNLINVGAGFYRLVGTKQNLGCQLTTGYYEITTVVPIINTNNVQLTHPVPQCNRLGAITGIFVSGAPVGTFTYTWTNQFGAIVGNALALSNLPAGRYTLTVTVSTDPTCFRTAGPFVLVDKLSPTLDLSAVIIQNASCGLPNGSITGIQILNATGAQQFTWKNAAGMILGTSINLNGVGAGIYQLEYDDAAPCPPITSPLFTIVNNGLVLIDETNKIIQPSGCTVVKGAITNMVVTGANLIQWENTATGAIVSNSVNLLSVPSGTYRLKVFDTNNGCSATSSDIFIPIATIDPLIIQSKNVKDEFCTAGDGYIKDLQFSSTPVGYIYKWVRNTTDTFAFSLDIVGLTKGSYELLGIDSNGCTQSILVQNILDHPRPQLSEATVNINDDWCTQSIGNITGINTVGGDAPFVYTWYSMPASAVVGNTIDRATTGAGLFQLVVEDKNNCRDTTSVFLVKNISRIIAPPKYDSVTYAKRGGKASIKNLIIANGLYDVFETATGLVPLLSNVTGNFITDILTSDKDYWVERVVGTCRSVRVKLHVKVIDFSNVYVPNAFTPNNDARNDVLKIKVYGKIILDGFTIYNRWGQPVFFTTDVNIGWDGSQKGIPLPTSTYTWFLQGYDIDGAAIRQRGTITLIR